LSDTRAVAVFRTRRTDDSTVQRQMLREERTSDLQVSSAVANAVLGHARIVSNDSIRLLNKPGPTTTAPA